MSKFIVTVGYSVGNVEKTAKFRARAKGIQYVKEQFHRYTHENYKSVNREEEDNHIHKFNASSSDKPFVQTLKDIEPVNEYELQGLESIKKV